MLKKYKCLKKKDFLFLQFYQGSITKFQTFYTKIWLNIKKYFTYRAQNLYFHKPD